MPEHIDYEFHLELVIRGVDIRFVDSGLPPTRLCKPWRLVDAVCIEKQCYDGQPANAQACRSVQQRLLGEALVGSRRFSIDRCSLLRLPRLLWKLAGLCTPNGVSGGGMRAEFSLAGGWPKECKERQP